MRRLLRAGSSVVAALLSLQVLADCAHSASPYSNQPDVLAGALPKVIQNGQPPQWVEYTIDSSLSAGATIVDHSSIWTADGYALDRLDIKTGALKLFAAPAGEGPQSVAVGPDGNLWATLQGAPAIGRMTHTGKWTVFDLKNYYQPAQILNGPLGRLWFVGGSISDDVMSMSTTGKVLSDVQTVFTINGFTVGPDGNLWFTQPGSGTAHPAGWVGRMTPGGALTEFSTPSGARAPLGIVAGSDGNLWFAEYDKSKIGSITTSGVVTEYAVPQYHPRVIGSQGEYVWFGHNEGLAKFDVATHAVTALGSWPNRDSSGYEGPMIEGPDGNMWFNNSDGYSGYIVAFVRNLITVSPKSMTLTVGENLALAASERPPHALTASSSDPNVATITGSMPPFTVAGVKRGSCKIVVTDDNLNFFDVSVTVQ